MRRFLSQLGVSTSSSICSHTCRYSKPPVSRLPVHRLPGHSLHNLSPAVPTAEDHVNEPKTSITPPADLLTTYQHLVAVGKIKSDDEQIRVVMQLRRLQKELENYAPPALTSHYLESTRPYVGERSHDSEPSGWWVHRPADDAASADLKALIRVKTHVEDLANLTTPKGLLLTGPPGSGKSFLVDLWFHALPTPYKARKHYNQLVLEIYRAVWEETQIRMAHAHDQPPAPPAPAPAWNRILHANWRQLAGTGLLPTKWTRFSAPPSAPQGSAAAQHTIAFAVAQRLLLRHWLLVFDEVQLLDVSSATLLADVLSWFWRMGGVVVGTSNRVPHDLYRNGVQRERLEPFVEALKARCPPVVLSSGRDWRAVRAANGAGGTWFTYSQEAEFVRVVENISDAEGQDPVTKTLSVFGREVRIPWALGSVCKFTFSELCEESLGPADYLSLASAFKTVIITDIPVLTLSAKNQARRFISLIDALYESRCQLVCLAQSAPAALFFPDAPAASEPTSSVTATHTSDATADVDIMLAESVGATRTAYRPNVTSYTTPAMSPHAHSNAHSSPPSPSPSPSQTAAFSFASAPPPALETLSIFSGKDEQFAFQRALSRLRAMTSAGYRRDERWAPLPGDVRKWERTLAGADAYAERHAGRTMTAGAGAALASAPREETCGPQPDFAEEAAYGEGVAGGVQGRPEAPRLRAEHMWGVRDDWNAHGASASARRGVGARKGGRGGKAAP